MKRLAPVHKNRYIGTMSTQKSQKLNHFLNEHKLGTVCLASWLEELGISRDLQKRYRKSGWLETVGPGAFKRPADELHWQGALYALQAQAALSIHAGALTALALQGLSHYLRTREEKIFLFLPTSINIPHWLKKADLKASIRSIRTSFLPPDVGLLAYESKTFHIWIAAPERAILECLFLTPNDLDLIECYHLMEGMVNLRPKLLQDLLEHCTSIKVKRLFLYMAQKAGHQWLQFINLGQLDLGKGKRSLVKGGVFDAEFQITIPKELAEL